MSSQFSLFDTRVAAPEGFAYAPDWLTEGEEQALVERCRTLPFRPFEFRGFLGKRRTVSFGWHYDFNRGGLREAEAIPDFLLPLRARAAVFAGLAEDALQHVLVIEYDEGAGIGWHRDRPEFGDVVGVSLLSPCTLRFRRRQGAKWERAAVTAARRSAYLLTGPARSEWEHSIPAVDALRYSITFRSFRGDR